MEFIVISTTGWAGGFDFTAILKNSLTDFQYKKEVQTKKIVVDIPECKFSRKGKRKPLTEYEEEVGDEL